MAGESSREEFENRIQSDLAKYQGEQMPTGAQEALGEALPNYQDFSKAISDAALSMQALLRATQDHQRMLQGTLNLTQQTTQLTQEQAQLTRDKAAAETKLQALNDKQLAQRYKQLELTKQEEQVVAKMRRGQQLTSVEQRTRDRLTSATAMNQALSNQQLTLDEAEHAGMLGGYDARYDASILRGGPERARRWRIPLPRGRGINTGITTSEGLSGGLGAAVRLPWVQAVLGGLSVMHGFEGMENQGAAGLVSSIPIIGGTIAGVLNQIPGLQAVSSFGSTTRLGQITGGGYRAGLGAQWQAFKMGANPFDVVSSQTATQIVAGAREAGFQGAMAQAFESAMLDVYKQTGIDPATLASIGTIFAKQGTGGLDQFRSTMENIDNIARDSSQSVANVADQIQTLTQQLSGTGAAHLGVAGDIVAAVSQVAPNLTPEQQKGLTTGFFGQQGLQQFSGFQGVAATTSIAQRIARRNQLQFLDAWKQQIQRLPRDQQDLMLANLVNAGFFDSVHGARAAIFHGHSIIHRMGEANRRRNAVQSFEEAHRAMEHTMAHLSLRRQMVIQHTEAGGGEGTNTGLAYIRSLRRNLHSSGFNVGQIAAITKPLTDVLLHGPKGAGMSWDQAIGQAHKRAIMQAEAGKNQYWSGGSSRHGHMITLRLDAHETRKLLSGKDISKKIQLWDAQQGSSNYVGTQFANPPSG